MPQPDREDGENVVEEERGPGRVVSELEELAREGVI